ncbi:MAG: toll/interleukin-1 receptor domain-containing protein [Hyphomonadaceae bacterium]
MVGAAVVARRMAIEHHADTRLGAVGGGAELGLAARCADVRVGAAAKNSPLEPLRRHHRRRRAALQTAMPLPWQTVARESRDVGAPAAPAGGAKDFFISRAGADADAAAWIARTLEDAGYSCIIQQRDFQLGGHFPQAMEDAFENCRAMIAVLSGEYTASPYCRDEWSVAYAFHRKESGGRLLPVRAAAGKLPPLAEALAYIDLIGVAELTTQWLLQGVRAFRERGRVAGNAGWTHNAAHQSPRRVRHREFHGSRS